MLEITRRQNLVRGMLTWQLPADQRDVLSVLCCVGLPPVSSKHACDIASFSIVVITQITVFLWAQSQRQARDMMHESARSRDLPAPKLKRNTVL